MAIADTVALSNCMTQAMAGRSGVWERLKMVPLPDQETEKEAICQRIYAS